MPASDSAPPWRRLAAVFYDVLVLIAIWMFAAALVLLAFHGEVDVAHQPALYHFVLQGVLLALTALYFVFSWSRGGQTIGMRAWRLRVTDAVGGAPGWRALWLRYLVGAIGLLAGGLGFWWAWIDRDRLAWHDRASGTRMQRIDKPTKA